VKAFGIESKWIGQSQGKLMNESGRRKSDSQSDWENLDAARKEERRRRRERRRGRRAKSAVLGTMMRERYDISDLDGPGEHHWHKGKKVKGKEEQKEEMKGKDDEENDDEEDENSSDVETEEEDRPKKVEDKIEDKSTVEKAINEAKGGVENEKIETAQIPVPLKIHSDTSFPIPGGYRRSLSAPNPNRKGILKDVNGGVAFDSDSRLSTRRRPSFLGMRALNQLQLRRRSSTMPPSMARERGKANLIVEDAIQRLQRLQRRVGAIQGPADDGVENELEALDGVREAAKRFAQKRREKATEEVSKKEQAKNEDGVTENGPQIEGEEQPRKRVNFQIESGKNGLEILPRPVAIGGEQAKMQWRRNSRTNLHMGAPEWRRPNQAMPMAMVDEDETVERLFPELVKTSAKLVLMWEMGSVL
jgi:hypothetical protein